MGILFFPVKVWSYPRLNLRSPRSAALRVCRDVAFGQLLMSWGAARTGLAFHETPIIEGLSRTFPIWYFRPPPIIMHATVWTKFVPWSKNVYLFVDYKCVLCTDKHQNVSTSNKDDLFRMSSSPGWIGCCGCWWHGTHLFLDSSQNVSKSSEQLSE